MRSFYIVMFLTMQEDFYQSFNDASLEKPEQCVIEPSVA